MIAGVMCNVNAILHQRIDGQQGRDVDPVRCVFYISKYRALD